MVIVDIYTCEFCIRIVDNIYIIPIYPHVLVVQPTLMGWKFPYVPLLVDDLPIYLLKTWSYFLEMWNIPKVIAHLKTYCLDSMSFFPVQEVKP